MTSAHPNRSRRAASPAANPSPAEIRAARHAAGLTLREAAALIHASMQAWKQWESGERRMHPAFWALFRMKQAMSPEEFRAIRRRLGLSANQMARALGYADGRAVRRLEAPVDTSSHRIVHDAATAHPDAGMVGLDEDKAS